MAAAGSGGLELVHADKSTGTKRGEEQLRIFSGHVAFQQDTLHMFCDEAVFYELENRADFIGNVLIDDGHHQIRAREIEYYPETRTAVCRGEVKLRSAEDSLYAEEFTYNFKSRHATARRDVFIVDYKNNLTIRGQYGEYRPELKYSLVREQARLMKVDSTGSDTMIVSASQMQYFNADPAHAVAIDSVEITQGTLRAVCDTAVYFPDEEVVDLKKNPHAWFEDSELSGMHIIARFDSLKIREINLSGEASAQTLVDSLKGTKNVLKGKVIDFFIQNQKPEKIISVGNASSIYYLSEDGTNEGVNYATSDTILVYFQEGELDSIMIRGGAEGIYYPDEYHGEKSFAEQ